mmetsp:Transcript_6023/g.23186  ORF Transcript_6023/g.23186 Transcript_6023/m.23186 type:complete len:254 (+) Transcript_6023:285-1046(+)
MAPARGPVAPKPGPRDPGLRARAQRRPPRDLRGRPTESLPHQALLRLHRPHAGQVRAHHRRWRVHRPVRRVHRLPRRRGVRAEAVAHPRELFQRSLKRIIRRDGRRGASLGALRRRVRDRIHGLVPRAGARRGVALPLLGAAGPGRRRDLRDGVPQRHRHPGAAELEVARGEDLRRRRRGRQLARGRTRGADGAHWRGDGERGDAGDAEGVARRGSRRRSVRRFGRFGRFRRRRAPRGKGFPRSRAPRQGRGR